MSRVVFDTNVVASALLWSGSPRNLLRMATEKRVSLFSSLPLLSELTDILSRPKFGLKLSASGFSADEIVDLYLGMIEIVVPVEVQGQAPDPDDDVVIGTAIAAKADLLVTGDKALLDMGFHEGGRIVSVAEAVRLIERSSDVGESG